MPNLRDWRLRKRQATRGSWQDSLINLQHTNSSVAKVRSRKVTKSVHFRWCCSVKTAAPVLKSDVVLTSSSQLSNKLSSEGLGALNFPVLRQSNLMSTRQYFDGYPPKHVNENASKQFDEHLSDKFFEEHTSKH